MITRKTLDTDHGTVDADVLAELRQSFVTSELLAAVDTISIFEGRHNSVRASLLRLHAMAAHLIIGSPQMVAGEEPIWQLAEEIADELDAHAANLSHVTKLLDRLGKLRPDNDAMGRMRT